MPQTEEYRGFAMMIALLPFWIVPWAVPALVIGLVLRGRAPRARGR